MRTLLQLLKRRRSVRRVKGGEIDPQLISGILEAARWAPSPYNVQPWLFVVVREGNNRLWDTIEAAERAERKGKNLERALERLKGFRGSIFIILIYRDQGAVERMLAEYSYLDPVAFDDWVRQALGMAQLLLWLAVTERGLTASLQHIQHAEEPIAALLGTPQDRFKLVAIMPVGYQDETLPENERKPLLEITSFERWG
ncbi:MAG: nitroreductase family protein [Anaerolineae bacterium]|nr:nitroreductase family protein [Anaerolineae bacterium]